MTDRRTWLQILGVLSSAVLLAFILACGDGEVAEPEPAPASSGGFLGGFVDAVNNDLAAASEEMGQQVEQANEAIAEGAAQTGEAVEQAEGAMDEAGEAIQEGEQEVRDEVEGQ